MLPTDGPPRPRRMTGRPSVRASGREGGGGHVGWSNVVHYCVHETLPAPPPHRQPTVRGCFHPRDQRRFWRCRCGWGGWITAREPIAHRACWTCGTVATLFSLFGARAGASCPRPPAGASLPSPPCVLICGFTGGQGPGCGRPSCSASMPARPLCNCRCRTGRWVRVWEPVVHLVRCTFGPVTTCVSLLGAGVGARRPPFLFSRVRPCHPLRACWART